MKLRPSSFYSILFVELSCDFIRWEMRDGRNINNELHRASFFVDFALHFTDLIRQKGVRILGVVCVGLKPLFVYELLILDAKSSTRTFVEVFTEEEHLSGPKAA